jgi:hypothetical protein
MGYSAPAPPLEEARMTYTAKTYTVRHHFTVEDGDGPSHFLRLEPAGAELPVLGLGFLTLNLREGTTPQEAEELASLLNKRVVSTGYTEIR